MKNPRKDGEKGRKKEKESGEKETLTKALRIGMEEGGKSQNTQMQICALCMWS